MMAQWLALLRHRKKGLNLPAGVVQLRPLYVEVV